MRSIYLDHNATTPPRSEVIEAMMPYLTSEFGNASSIHRFGRQARTAVLEARESLAEALGARPEEIVFTSGGTESDNLAILGTAYANRHTARHIVTSAIEHHAVLHTCRFLEREGFTVTYLSPDRTGLLDPAHVEKAICSGTILVTIMHANNEVGTIQPIEDIGLICRGRGVTFHTDAVQAFGKIPVHVEQMHLDLLSLSGHKIYGPKGTGALYIRKGVPIAPLFHGGDHERGRRAGTENVPGIVGLGAAARLAMADMAAESERLSGLRDELHRRIMSAIDHVHLNGHPDVRLPGTLNLSFAGTEGESIVINLDLQGIAVSAGSACAAGAAEPSHILTAMGLSAGQARGSVRFSLGKDNTAADIDRVMEILPALVSRQRALSEAECGNDPS